MAGLLATGQWADAEGFLRRCLVNYPTGDRKGAGQSMGEPVSIAIRTSTPTAPAGWAFPARYHEPSGMFNQQIHGSKRSLRSVEDAAFDLTYMQGQVIDHQKTVILLQWEIRQGQDAQCSNGRPRRCLLC